MGRFKRKNAFEHAQNVQIPTILCMRKTSSGSLLSTVIVNSVKWFC